MADPSIFITSDVKTVTLAGTQETLVAASTPCNKVILQALAANGGMIYVGGSDIAAGEGHELDARETLTLDIDDAFKVWVDTSNSGDKVSFIILGGN